MATGEAGSHEASTAASGVYDTLYKPTKPNGSTGETEYGILEEKTPSSEQNNGGIRQAKKKNGKNRKERANIPAENQYAQVQKANNGLYETIPAARGEEPDYVPMDQVNSTPPPRANPELQINGMPLPVSEGLSGDNRADSDLARVSKIMKQMRQNDFTEDIRPKPEDGMCRCSKRTWVKIAVLSFMALILIGLVIGFIYMEVSAKGRKKQGAGKVSNTAAPLGASTETTTLKDAPLTETDLPMTLKYTARVTLKDTRMTLKDTRVTLTDIPVETGWTEIPEWMTTSKKKKPCTFRFEDRCYWVHYRGAGSTTFADARELCYEKDMTVANLYNLHHYLKANAYIPSFSGSAVLWLGMKVDYWSPRIYYYDGSLALGFTTWLAGYPIRDLARPHMALAVNLNPAYRGMMNLHPYERKDGMICESMPTWDDEGLGNGGDWP